MTDSIYTRTEILLGEPTLNDLIDHHILIAGLGGVGSFVAESLGRLGIKRLSILDHDVVAPSNLNRQLVALHSTLGQPKVEVMAARLLDINPNIQLIKHGDFLHKEQAHEFIQTGNYDFVVDCIDSIASKAALVAACLRLNVPIASSMGAGNRLDVSKVKVAKLNQTEGCGLARELRALLRKEGVRTNYPVIYSQEIPRQPLPHQPVSGVEGRPRAVNGTISYMPALFGMMLSGVVVQALLKQIEEKQETA
ncbi:dinucleotide-utilizing enzyme possibly involved in molybdopterin or thiamin biosynthesis [Beggiatoa alba B18LD]|uniref:Dinucleotide-utilizing enzyme possibly involved in molybdopterin or thiamin biosynthesis n=1 Tax=Beggiatoa alba B18LD TaxID=395493 RepID=I3CBY6_9GAMM|nr:tRNA threonylcarbamoyladenosine dehydratase [Beggiatoa alba]EIJ41129.1 dinucleotide-utilizing enzyme possibly involved in molybdopterin or thiamin biosynthesis [Beggiatoa alba B18LD]